MAKAKKAAASAKGVPPAPSMRIEMMALGEVKKFPGNPKMHDLESLGASIDDHGYVDPLVIDERTGMVGAGHGRIEDLERRKAAGDPPPKRVEVGPGGEWFVPVIRGVSFKDDEAFRRYVIGANRISEIGGWDNKLLAEMLAPMDKMLLGSTGFAEGDVAMFLSLGKGENPRDHWTGMPGFENADLSAWKTVHVHFRNEEDYRAFAKMVGQPNMTLDTRFIWHPELVETIVADKRYVADKGAAAKKGKGVARAAAR